MQIITAEIYPQNIEKFPKVVSRLVMKIARNSGVGWANTIMKPYVDFTPNTFLKRQCMIQRVDIDMIDLTVDDEKYMILISYNMQSDDDKDKFISFISIMLKIISYEDMPCDFFIN